MVPLALMEFADRYLINPSGLNARWVRQIWPIPVWPILPSLLDRLKQSVGKLLKALAETCAAGGVKGARQSCAATPWRCTCIRLC